MKDNAQILENYHKSTQNLLEGHPGELATFEKLWDSDEFRKAYVFVMDLVEHLKLTRSQENLKANEDFFWTYMH